MVHIQHRIIHANIRFLNIQILLRLTYQNIIEESLNLVAMKQEYMTEDLQGVGNPKYQESQL